MELKIGTAVLPMVNKIKILGIYICHDLNWRYQISCVRKKVNSMASVLHRFGSTLNCDTRAKIFGSFIKPHLLYALPVWCNAGSSIDVSMDRTIRHAVRIILRNKYAELDKQTAKTLDILPFKLTKLKYNVLRIFKILSNNNNNAYLDSELLSATSSYSTRGADPRKFNILKHKRSADEYCFQFASFSDWNCLPNNLTS